MKQVKSIILFGSHARGDSVEGSDLDLLGITGFGLPETATQMQVNMNLYDERHFSKMCIDGDLFALHIVREAKPLWDPYDCLGKFKSIFKYKKSYEEDFLNTADICWMLIDASRTNYASRLEFGKKISWCVRTALIIQSLNLGDLSFNKLGWSKFIDFHLWETLVDLKRSDDVPYIEINKFENFLYNMNLNRRVEVQWTALDYENHFRKNNNSIGLKYLNSLYEQDFRYDPYESFSVADSSEYDVSPNAPS